MLITSESKYVIVRILSNLTMLVVQNYSICIELYDQNKIPYYSIIENDKKMQFCGLSQRSQHTQQQHCFLMVFFASFHNQSPFPLSYDTCNQICFKMFIDTFKAD